METLLVTSFVLVFIAGVSIGATVKNMAWSSNSKRKTVVRFLSKRYKVVELDNVRSLNLLEKINVV